MHSAPDAARGGSTSSSRQQSHLEILEAQLARAHEAQAAQKAAVEDELARLSSIYDRVRADLRTAREERDRAVEEARRERERRAREALELAAKLQAAENPADEFVRRRLPPVPLERKTLLPGHLPEVDGFRVIGLIGRGGMASVFRAERESDGRQVALKLLMGERGSSRSRTELFLREAAMMLQVDHPNLLRALDAGECEYGHYLVLPLIEGQNLAGRVRRKGPLTEEDALFVAIEAARALRYCARGGLTHRDVKPSNLLESPDGRILLCDFGLAALHDDDSGRPYGSPGFASPEQILTPDDVDERADIYGLATTLWCLVVGKRPFQGDARTSFEAARDNDLSDPRMEGADISPRLARVIRRMGRCERDRRYRSWDECLLDLELVERGNPPLAAQLSEALGTDHVPAEEPPPAPAPAPTDDVPAEAGDALAPRTQSAPFPRLMLTIACVLTLLVGGLVTFAVSRSPADELEARARALAASGRAKEAATALRNAAELLGGDEGERLRRLAEELVRRR